MTGAGTDVVFDPFQPGFTDDPYPHYARMRAAGPVHHHPLGFWLLWRHADVSALLRDRLSVEDANAGPSAMRDFYESVLGDRPRRGGGLSMLDRDPPDHTRLRRLVSKAFTPRTVQQLRPRVEELVDRAVATMRERGDADLIADLAFPLPFTVISEMLGMPETDHLRLRELSHELVRSLEPVVDPAQMRAIVDAEDELFELAAAAVAWKREHPADDLLTALIGAEEDGDVLSDEELVSQVILLYVAGHETTVNLIGNGMLALLRHPGQLDALRTGAVTDQDAVEELLRFDSPVQLSRRITLEPYTVAGVTIPAGAFVIACLASANRDEQFWGPTADRLELGRESARQHLSFGSGVHHCLGAALARLEAQVAVGRLVRGVADICLADEPQCNGRINLRGLTSLPVRMSTG